MIKCKECGGWFRTKRGYNIHYNRMHECNHKQKKISPSFDFNEIKLFITSEIKKVLKEFSFNKAIIKNDGVNVGIVPIKTVKKIPIFNPFEADKRLVMKELKKQLKAQLDDGIDILQKVGSFDDQIKFLEVPVEILV